MKTIGIILILAILAVAVWQFVTWPDVAALAKEDPESTSFMRIRQRQLQREGKNSEILYDFVPYSRISPTLRRAVLVSEDSGFYDHEGVEVEAMKEALRKNWEERKLAMGGSTITQQLAKNLWLSPSKNPLRKVKEYFLARSLEKHLTKKRILELYLNVVEMGERVYGAEAAARFYFDKSAASLSAREAALLAGCLPNPRVMNPGDPNGRLRARQRIILSRLGRWGRLAEEEVLTQRTKIEAPPTETVATGSLEPEPEALTIETIDPTATVAPAETSAPTDTAAPAEPPPTETSEPPPTTDTTATSTSP